MSLQHAMLLLVAVILVVPAHASGQHDAPVRAREAAVESARRGAYETAISSLQALAQMAPSDTGVRFDLAVVLQWAGRSREATDVFESTRATDAPEYALSAMTHAYRDQQRWADAARLAAEGGRRFPESVEWPLAARLAEAGAALEAGDSYAALRAYLAARLLAPDDEWLRREVSGILVRLGAPFAAGLHAAGRDPGIEARQAAALVNQATAIPAVDPVHRFDRTDRALARLESLLDDARAASPPDDGLVTRLRGDRVVALRDRERWLDVAGEVTALRQEGRPIPAYSPPGGSRRLARTEAPGRGARSLRGRPCRRAAVAFRARGAVLRAARRRARERRAGTGRRDGGGGRAEDVARRVASADRQLGLARRAGARGHRPLLRRRVPRGLAPAASRSWTAHRPCRSCDRRKRRLRARAGGRGSPTRRRTSPPRSRRRIDPPRSRSPRRRSREGATTRPGGAPRRSCRSSPATRRWSGCAAACARTMPPEGAPRIESRTEYGNASRPSGLGLRRPIGAAGAAVPRALAPQGRVRVLAASPVEGVVRRTRYGAGVEADWPDASLEATVWIDRGTLDRAGGDLPAHGRLATTCGSGEGERYSAETPLRATFYGISADGGSGHVSYAWDSATIASAAACGARGSPTATTGSKPAPSSPRASSSGRASPSSCGRSCGGAPTRGSTLRTSIPGAARRPT